MIIKAKGGAGPYGMDADGWRRTFISKNFSKSSDDLYKTFAAVIKRICVESNLSLEAFLLCRLIPLDKNLGLRTNRSWRDIERNIWKSRGDFISSVCSLQGFGVHEEVCEAAIRAINAIFQEWNAFNSINRNVFLHNISIIYPAIIVYMHTCHSSPSGLFVF